MALTNVETLKNMDMDLGIIRHEDEDELFLRRLSVYATVRPCDLKVSSQTDGHKSLADLFNDWGISEQTASSREESGCEADHFEQLELRDHELSVKGFDIDSRISPGFRYTVRYIGTNEYLYDGEARCLQSIGLGYGRRLTFKGDKLNFNDCFFWSDSIPRGYAFSIAALREGDIFTVADTDSQPIGTVEVQQVDFPQVEMDTIIEGGNVVKNVKVRFACFIKMFNLHTHSLVNVNTQELEVTEGVAQLVKEKGSKEAIVKCIKNVHFNSIGKCTLHCDP